VVPGTTATTAPGTTGTTGPSTGVSGTVADLLAQAAAKYDAAQAALTAGKLGDYQTDIDAVGKLLQQAQALASPSTATTTTTKAPTTTTTASGSNPQALSRASSG
jgi:hypothetical protein